MLSDKILLALLDSVTLGTIRGILQPDCSVLVATDRDALWQAVEEQCPGVVVLASQAGDVAGEILPRLRSILGERAGLVVVAPQHEGEEGVGVYFEAGASDIALFPRGVFRLRHRLPRMAAEAKAHAEVDAFVCQMRDTVERYELALRGTDDGLWDAMVYMPHWFDPQNKIWYSSRFKQILGYEDDEFDNRLESWQRLVHPEDQRRVHQALDNHLHHHTPFDIEYRVFTKNGELRWLRGLGLALWDRNDLPTRMAGSIRDITAWKDAEEERDRFFQESVDLLAFANVQGYFLRVNPEFCRVLGYTAEELTSRPFLDFVHPDDRDRTIAEVESLRAGEDTLVFENRYICKDGSIRWLAWRTSAPKPGTALLFAVARDVTAQHEAKAAIAREQALLKQMLDLQERDRKLIAYEIHDGLVQQMAAALMHLETFRDVLAVDPPRAEKNRERACTLLREAVDEARRLISGLRPPALDDVGVLAAIAHVVDHARPTIPDVIFQHDGELPALPEPLENTLFRIAQESVTNAVRHSRSPRLEAELTYDGDFVTLRVQDWGVGFDPQGVSGNRYGLQGMRERCRLLDCELQIDSRPGQGTTIICRLPILSP